MKDIVSQQAPLEGKRYLDVGCVHGRFPLAFKQVGVCEAIGIDNNPSWIECSKALAEDITLKCHAIGKIFWIPMTSMG